MSIKSYDGLAEVATPAVRQAIYTFGIYIPLLLFVVMFILTLYFGLEAKLPSMREEIAKRKANK